MTRLRVVNRLQCTSKLKVMEISLRIMSTSSDAKGDEKPVLRATGIRTLGHALPS